MQTLIEDITAITVDAENRVLNSTDIAIDNKVILTVDGKPETFNPDVIIDGSNMVALPAFFNAHTHAAMTLERGWAEDLPFDRWLNEKIWVAESALQEEDVYWGASLAIAEMLRAGVVGFADHYFWMNQTAKAVEDSGVKALLAWCHFGLGSDMEVGGTSFDDTVAFVKNWQRAAEGRIHTILGPHSPYMVPQDVLIKFVNAAQDLGVGAHFHLSESQQQVRNSLDRYGKTPVAYVSDLGLLNLPGPSLVAHCNAVIEEELSILAESGAYVAHAPKTYQKLAMQMPPLKAMLENNVNVGLGTDGPASNSDLNLFDPMRITGLHQKFSQRDPEAMPRDLLLRMATQASAAAMGFCESGVLAAGHPADIILVDTTAPHWFPRHDLVAGIVYTAHPGDVAYVWCDGKLLYRKGEYLTLDMDRIRWEAEHRAFRMVGREMTSLRTYQA